MILQGEDGGRGVELRTSNVEHGTSKAGEAGVLNFEHRTLNIERRTLKT